MGRRERYEKGATMAPPTCEVHPLTLWALMAGELAPEQRRRIQLHLAWCTECCAELARVRDTERLLAAGATPAIPEPVQRRLEQVVDRLEAGEGGSALAANGRAVRGCASGWPRR